MPAVGGAGEDEDGADGGDGGPDDRKDDDDDESTPGDEYEVCAPRPVSAKKEAIEKRKGRMNGEILIYILLNDMCT